LFLLFLLCYKEIKNAISFLIFGILFYRAAKTCNIKNAKIKDGGIKEKEPISCAQ